MRRLFDILCIFTHMDRIYIRCFDIPKYNHALGVYQKVSIAVEDTISKLFLVFLNLLFIGMCLIL